MKTPTYNCMLWFFTLYNNHNNFFEGNGGEKADQCERVRRAMPKPGQIGIDGRIQSISVVKKLEKLIR